MGVMNCFRSFSTHGAKDASAPIANRPVAAEEIRSLKPQIFIAGLGTVYPPHILTAKDFEDYVRATCDVENEPALQKILLMKTQIETRHLVIPLTSSFFQSSIPPTLAEINNIFAIHSLPLTLAACRAALLESSVLAKNITHTVAVTSTNFSLPGYDFAVAQELGLGSCVERTLIGGVGCAGGMAALRIAFNLSFSASARGKPARILVMACEICSLNIRAVLSDYWDPKRMNITPILFGDAAGAVVICNELAVAESDRGIKQYEVLDWGCEALAGTMNDMNMTVESRGYSAYMGRNVPSHAINSILPMLHRLVPSPNISEYDWAVHPGGISILTGAQKSLEITEQHLRASYHVYKNRGNTAAVTILSVLDSLRKMGEGREKVVACAFGPGMIIEMASLRRC